MSTAITVNIGALTSTNVLLGSCLVPQPLALNFKDESLPDSLFDIRSSVVGNIVDNIFPSPTYDMFSSKTFPSSSGSSALNPYALLSGCAVVAAAGGAYAGRLRSSSVVGTPGPSAGRITRGRAARSAGENDDGMQVRNSQPPKTPRRGNGSGDTGKKKKGKKSNANKRYGNDPEDDDPPPPPSSAEYYEDDDYNGWLDSRAGRFFGWLLFAIIYYVSFNAILDGPMFTPKSTPHSSFNSKSARVSFADIEEHIQVVPEPEPQVNVAPAFLIIAFLFSAYTAHRLINLVCELPQIMWDSFFEGWVSLPLLDEKGKNVGALNSG